MNVDTTSPQAPLAGVESKQDGASNEATAKAESTTHDQNESSSFDERPVHSALSERQRSALLAVASFAAAISPASTTTYYPAITTLANDLDVSITQINLSLPAYQIFQGLAPTVAAAFSDRFGRRPVYLVSLSINMAANLGLALQKNYASLMVLRCLQSSSSGGTVALGQAVMDDLITSEERGRYMAYLTLGLVMGPALGPLIGGLLSQYLGWRAIFWFLMILGGFFFLMVLTFFRETNRSIVGDGSVPPQKWNRSLVQIFRKDKLIANPESLAKKRISVNPLASIQILRNKENFIVCMYGALLFGGYASVISIFATQLEERYGYSQVQVGLCYLPFGVGSILSRWTAGKMIDWNFKREADKQGFKIVKNRQQDLSRYDIEKARLTVSFPMIFATCGFVVAYGWLMQYDTHVASVLVVVFLIANVFTGVLIANSALLNDLNPGNGAALGAAMNLTRCLMGAGGVAAVTPLINKIGIGYTATATAGVWVVTLPALYLVYSKGYTWRKAALEASSQDRRENPDVASGSP
uniref:MFS-type transporter clz19 n=1 Tax=Cochliobolus lunatus TaxID=5503 RepID=CLZ19_COCLU|nr:RecName: Full=MFS-type transporter clz19; AltName: Full=Squalestatin S1 biosynthesis cluster protein clz19; AltName: Full=Zaragozic acid A biosynthesis cluster protein 19 [Curvularia lunata]AXF50662.1 MFS [Curvularia lunata]